jgi:lactoylglutathione lyase
MAKAAHMMIRVLEEERSVKFYQSTFGFQVSHRLALDDFTLVYMRAPEAPFEIELTINLGRKEPYEHGSAYGHIAFVVDDLDAEHRRFVDGGLQPNPIKEFKRGDELLARFFFVTDHDGYRIEVLQRHGHYQ